MSDPLVSIIVPVYNGQQFVSRCLNSIKCLNINNWECIVIDDGSIDDSQNIITSYARSDTRFKLITTQHGGVSKARNLGLSMAAGRWVSFVDIDDWISPDYFDYLALDEADQYDIVLFTSCHNNENVICSFSQYESVFGEKSIKMLLSAKMGEDIFRSPWGKVVKMDLIRNHKLHFNESLRYGEDTIFNLDAFAVCNSINCCKQGLYHYYVPDEHVPAYQKYGRSADQVMLFLNEWGKRYFSMGISNVKYERLTLWGFVSVEKWCNKHNWSDRKKYYHNVYLKMLEKRILKSFNFYQRLCYRFCNLTPDSVQWARTFLVSRY